MLTRSVPMPLTCLKISRRRRWTRKNRAAVDRSLLRPGSAAANDPANNWPVRGYVRIFLAFRPLVAQAKIGRRVPKSFSSPHPETLLALRP
jgi:hypothetical protein